MSEYYKRLQKYAQRIDTCGEHRNSYSKTDRDATFMRIKRDYMGNDQLLPAYNMQAAICDECIAAIDTQQVPQQEAAAPKNCSLKKRNP